MRNVLVTGASRGLGLAIAQQLAADGFRVLATARSNSDALAALTEQTAGAVQFKPYDLLDLDNIPDFVKGLRQEFGPIFGLVNNAGIEIGRAHV